MNNKNDGPNLNGPEAMPLRDYVKDFPLVIAVYKSVPGKEDELVRKEEINYGNAEHRKWLGKITYWACSNHYSVETMAAEDYKLGS